MSSTRHPVRPWANRGSRTTNRWRPGRALPHSAPRTVHVLEIRLVNVALIENERLPKQDVVAPYFHLSEGIHTEGSGARFQGSVGQSYRGLHGEIAQIL